MSKWKAAVFLVSAVALVLTGCQSESAIQQQFNRETAQRIEEKAQEYSNSAYQSGEVPLKSYIKMKGKITKTDAKDITEIGKSDRFVIESAGVSYQVINSTSTSLSLEDDVIVYGEYQGVIQAEKIEVRP